MGRTQGEEYWVGNMRTGWEKGRGRNSIRRGQIGSEVLTSGGESYADWRNTQDFEVNEGGITHFRLFLKGNYKACLIEQGGWPDGR